ncbi:hypothetical protein XENOCAPTIV_026662 [Xenoophorus captivus]|uniref:Uncharacterized protein n=1 Tax=Xenoophorus captivus TaxID=1517983 RepID=A0ABV0SET2_9TELE
MLSAKTCQQPADEMLSQISSTTDKEDQDATTDQQSPNRRLDQETQAISATRTSTQLLRLTGPLSSRQTRPLTRSGTPLDPFGAKTTKSYHPGLERETTSRPAGAAA